MSGLATSRPLSQEEIARCRRVADAVAKLDDPRADHWVNPQGKRVHGQISRIAHSDIDEAFFNELRPNSFIFSGYRLSNLRGEQAPSWNDALAAVFDPGGTALDWSVPAFRACTKHLAAEEIFSPPLIMGEVGYVVDGYCVNRDVVAYQERINLMRALGVLDRLKRESAPLILEIGGGYGALAYYLKRRYPRATYVIVDLPRSLLFSGCYLAAALPDFDVHVFAPGRANVVAGAINLVSNLHLEQLPALHVDAAINTLSFAEMSADTVADYCRWLERHLSDDGVLFEQNFDNRHYGLAQFSGPSEIIDSFLRRREARTRDVHWGPASVWVKRTSLQKVVWMVSTRVRSLARRMRRIAGVRPAARSSR